MKKFSIIFEDKRRDKLVFEMNNLGVKMFLEKNQTE